LVANQETPAGKTLTQPAHRLNMHRVDIMRVMASRTISLTEDAYERLRRSKRAHESFSDVVRRLTRGRSILELATVMPPDGAKRVADAIDRSRAEQLALRKKDLGL
jgi:predicted CopG family antitoxin